MNTHILQELIAHESDHCLTVILDTDQNSFADKEKITIKLRNAVSEAKRKMQERGDNSATDSMLAELETLINQVDINQARKGLGLFISPGFSRIVDFPFKVEPRTIIDSSFYIRDVLRNANKMLDYKVLQLSKGHSRLFQGSGLDLREIKGDGFPKEYEEQFQFQTIRPARPGQQFYTNEQSRINQQRVEDFLRSLDRDFGKHLLEHEPILLVGVDKILSTYKSVSEYSNRVIGDLEGNFDHHSSAEIAAKTWPLIEARRKEKKAEILKEAKDKLYTGKAVSGIQAVWEAVFQNRGEILIAEKDYSEEAYTDELKTRITLKKGEPDTGNLVPDAVEDAMEHLLSQQGTQVITVENGELEEYGRLILITRY